MTHWRRTSDDETVPEENMKASSRTCGFLRAAALLVVALLWPLAAAAQDDGTGVAITHVPDGGFWACHGDNADTTLACSRRKCREGDGEPCYRVRWCFPAGWSGAMTYLENREVTRTTFLCGAPNGTALVRMLAAQCAAMEGATECRLAVAWNPRGEESEPNALLGKNTAD